MAFPGKEHSCHKERERGALNLPSEWRLNTLIDALHELVQRALPTVGRALVIVAWCKHGKHALADVHD
eukprot:6917042-Prymnesium_polylepis.1